MKRFHTFTDDQAAELNQALRDHDKRLTLVAVLLIAALALGFGFGLKAVGDTSHHADTALRAANQVLRDRANDARALAAANEKKAAQARGAAYAACRRQQESARIGREFFALLRPVLLATDDPHQVKKFFHDAKAQNGLSIPKCIKPPKGS